MTPDFGWLKVDLSRFPPVRCVLDVNLLRYAEMLAELLQNSQSVTLIGLFSGFVEL